MKILLASLFIILLSSNQDDIHVIGNWSGSINVEAQNTVLPIVFHIKKTPEGMKATMDSPDQNAFDIAFDEITYEGGKLTLKMNQNGATFEGSPVDGEIVGKWMQSGQEFDLTLKRITKTGRS